MTNPQYPQNRPVWNATDLEAGEFASLDNGQLQVSEKVGSGNPIKFGTFAAIEYATNTVKQFTSGAPVAGVAMISNQVKNYGEREYLENEIAAIGKRGFAVVKIDPAFPPAMTDPNDLAISFEAGKEGWLSNGTNPNASPAGVNASGVADIILRRVGAEVAEVYLSGVGVYITQ